MINTLFALGRVGLLTLQALAILKDGWRFDSPIRRKSHVVKTLSLGAQAR